MIRAKGWWLEQARWHIGRPFRAAWRALRSLNYEPQHVDPWHESAEILAVLPRTLPAPEFEPVLVAPRVVGGEAWFRATEPELPLLLGDAWLHAHWWWYAAERQREADDYHNYIEADRRRWRAENGLPALELAAAA